ncbi:excalibur calcium-binding domain-containing protein [Cellulosimicrobium funkei]|uniref:excalibur calcium-binding domain-containing protein n=1 Tax=Cellulosimicrobium TaxID=157920 RepID=UPI0020A4ACA2|nr:excalibur calcium-binding domain-containing protein [Cellulosimicrobium sp. 72-3]
MAQRFNAPPGWPVAPGDWRPEPGWAPDPAWPSAPEGWTFWVEETAAPPAGATRPRRGRRAALLTAAGVALFVVGLLVGQGSSGRALDEARTLVAQAADEQDEVEGERAELDAERTALEEQTAAAQAAQTELDERATALQSSEADVAAREGAVATVEADLATRVSDVEGREAAVAQAEAAAAAARSTQQSRPSAPAGVADTGGSTSTYYQNCDAVRAAGAAPLLRGEPGYAPKLDRDGDGVACE